MSYINSRSYELVVQKFVELYNSKYVHGMSQEYYGRTLPEPIEKVIKYLAANNFSTNEYIRDWAQDVEMPESLDNKIIYKSQKKFLFIESLLEGLWFLIAGTIVTSITSKSKWFGVIFALGFVTHVISEMLYIHDYFCSYNCKVFRN